MTTDPTPAGRGGDLIVLGLLTVATVALAIWHGNFLQFFCDDSYISYRFAQNLARGEGPVFNPGERVEGYTNFLWVLMLVPGFWLGVSAEAWSLTIGAILMAGTLLLTAVFVTRRLELRRGFAAVPAFLLVCLGPFILWSLSGLETILFTGLILAAITVYELRGDRPRGALQSGLLYAAAAMTRPDGALFGLAAGLHLLLTSGWSGAQAGATIRRALAMLGGFAVPFAAHALWRRWYYDDWLPNTFYVKSGGLANVPLGWQYVREFAAQYPAASGLAVLGLIGGLIAARGAQRRTFTHLALAIALFGSYLFWAGGDYMALFRFFVPLLPLAMIASCWLLARVYGSVAPRLSHPAAAGLGLVLLGGFAWLSFQPSAASMSNTPSAGVEVVAPAVRMRRNSELWCAAGRALKDNLPPDTWIATTAAGAIPYYSELPTLDQSGLCDRYTAKEDWDPWLPDRPGHMKQSTKTYLLERQPEVVLWHPQIRPVADLRSAIALPPEGYVMRGLRLDEMPEQSEPMALLFWCRRDAADRLGRDGGVQRLSELQ